MNVPSSCSPIGRVAIGRGRFSGHLNGCKSRHPAPRLRESVLRAAANKRTPNEPAGPCPRASSIVHNVHHETPKWRAIVARLDALPFSNPVSKLCLVSIRIHGGLRQLNANFQELKGNYGT